jgi:hypothetical protein
MGKQEGVREIVGAEVAGVSAMTARHKWSKGVCLRHKAGLVIGACPASESGRPCEASNCANCGLLRRKERFVAGPEVGDELRIDKPRFEYFSDVLDEYVMLDHVPECVAVQRVAAMKPESEKSDWRKAAEAMGLK